MIEFSQEIPVQKLCVWWSGRNFYKIERGGGRGGGGSLYHILSYKHNSTFVLDQEVGI